MCSGDGSTCGANWWKRCKFKRERWSARIFSTPGICSDLKRILNVKHFSANGLTNFMMRESFDDNLFRMKVSAWLSVWKMMCLFFNSCPHRCTANTIGNSSKTVISNDVQSFGHSPKNHRSWKTAPKPRDCAATC